MPADLHNLHLATESRERAPPIIWRPWFLALATLCGILLGVAVMLVTDTAEAPTVPAFERTFEMVVRP